jgi:hypothetical protein
VSELLSFWAPIAGNVIVRTPRRRAASPRSGAEHVRNLGAEARLKLCEAVDRAYRNGEANGPHSYLYRHHPGRGEEGL